MKGSCLILFRSDSCTLERAEQELRAYNLQVHQNGNSLMVERSGSSKFQIVLVREPHVIKEAQEIAEGTEYEQSISLCDARFEVTIDDLEMALDEINTLMEVQGALQDASSGYAFLPWNGQIIKPWVG
ncbi:MULTISPECIES: hypothetical protein [unclassified Acinetobacter]|jgi:hypothetical protein|uniref:hypothetical protein n=1 Tax=Acinetobacter TaxID=469 RepID=UPI000B3CD6A8|nr:hypothetical protein [Acinetobacter sp. WCHA29]